MIPKESLKKYVLTGITILTLVEAYFYYRALKDYIGVYQASIFIPLLLQPIFYRKLFQSGEKVSLKSWKVLPLIAVSLLLPLLIWYTIPDYTYEEGKALVEASMDESAVFPEQEFQSRTIPAMGRQKGILHSNRIYYYTAEVDGTKSYHVVDPITGDVQELEEDYFRRE
ncbi:hypothetical protein J3A84_05015 [Proteiniclasticum sp. SCR006]|uniref:Uncharacterized protein n=1 Tax=Proteiniclasticum aestuarii TaxID=2817862 RepID=A0A939HAD4_9CLOT|nr:hypothetical protein [Proteiniclasticum aestuarii]MBO1264401.1 hypothetical protein [Proteiniclasticum aestuarii]